MIVREVQPRNDRFRENKVVGKQKVVETKEAPKAANPYARPTPVKCFKYNQPNHRSSDCPLKRAVHLVKRDDKDANEVCCETDGYRKEEEDYEDDDEGHNYVVKTLILTPKYEENTQHHQLFRTRCTINNKLFELIIDNGSCENIISREAVKLLKLLVEKHPNSYSIGWIKAAEKIEVKEQCKVPFFYWQVPG